MYSSSAIVLNLLEAVRGDIRVSGHSDLCSSRMELEVILTPRSRE
jgi:hypothetical protein